MIFKLILIPQTNASDIANFEANYKSLSTAVLDVQTSDILLPTYAQFLSRVGSDWADSQYTQLTTPEGNSYTLTYNQQIVSTAANQATEIANLQAINSLTPSRYDFILLSYTGDDLTSVVYKLGGSGGTVISTLTLAYLNGVLQSVTKS